MGELFAELHPPLSAAAARAEADRCLACGGPAGAPCIQGCPAGVDVPAFIASIAEGDPLRAARIVFDANVLGGSCARVCPVEELCARDCVLLHEGRPAIDIAGLQRYATDAAFRRSVPLRRRARSNLLRVAVIGAGPAGLAAAGELAAQGCHVDVYDERRNPGGLLRDAIAPYRQLVEPLPEEVGLLARLGVRFRFETDVDEPLLRRLEDTRDAIVLAIGMGGDAEVAYPGDDLYGVWDSLPFIAQVKSGYPPAIGEHVVVIGGGNTAVDCAVEACRLGAKVVTMVYRRTRDEMPAYAHEVELAEHEGVRFEWLAAPVRFIGGETLKHVELRRMELGEADASGRRRPVEVMGSEFVIAADTAIKAIGQRPRSAFVSLIDGVELDHGRIVVDEHGRTGNPRYYAAGDAVSGGATVVDAVRGAKVVARGICEVPA
jgi:glutamate synthase (NADPH/NADH) small chain